MDYEFYIKARIKNWPQFNNISGYRKKILKEVEGDDI
jgi:hypothetical protein